MATMTGHAEQISRTMVPSFGDDVVTKWMLNFAACNNTALRGTPLQVRRGHRKTMSTNILEVGMNDTDVVVATAGLHKVRMGVAYLSGQSTSLEYVTLRNSNAGRPM